ncbi:MAG: hypothetical protein RLZZ104_1537 [Pseudomonadota bacterium]|jgi:hypothetical protein
MFVASPDTPMAEAETLRAEDMLRRREITQSDMCWLMGLEDDEEDRPVPRGFKSWRQFQAMLWHKEQRAKGRKVPKRRRKAA